MSMSHSIVFLKGSFTFCAKFRSFCRHKLVHKVQERLIILFDHKLYTYIRSNVRVVDKSYSLRVDNVSWKHINLSRVNFLFYFKNHSLTLHLVILIAIMNRIATQSCLYFRLLG